MVAKHVSIIGIVLFVKILLLLWKNAYNIYSTGTYTLFSQNISQYYLSRSNTIKKVRNIYQKKKNITKVLKRNRRKIKRIKYILFGLNEFILEE